MIKLPAMPCIYEISWEKVFFGCAQTCEISEIFNLEKFQATRGICAYNWLDAKQHNAATSTRQVKVRYNVWLDPKIPVVMASFPNRCQPCP